MFNLLFLQNCRVNNWSLIYYYENYAVKALREIGEQLKKNDWNFHEDPCENDSSWVTPQSDLMPLYNNSITCDCSYPYAVCHVVKLYVQLSFCFVSFIICSSWLSSRPFLLLLEAYNYKHKWRWLGCSSRLRLKKFVATLCNEREYLHVIIRVNLLHTNYLIQFYMHLKKQLKSWSWFMSWKIDLVTQIS